MRKLGLTHGRGVRLRESLPLPNISQMLSEQLPCPAMLPGAHRERSSIVSSRPLLLIVSSMGGSSKLESNKRRVGGGVGMEHSELIRGRQAGKALDLTLKTQARH